MQTSYRNFILRFITFTCSVFLFMGCGYSDNDQLFVSSGEGDIEKVKAFLKKGADKDHRFQHLQRDFKPYETPIMAASEKGHLEIVKILVKAGADIETQNTYNAHTALYKAVKNKHRKVIEYLLAKGANPMAEQTLGKNLLMMAIEQNDFSLIKLLVKYGAWPDPKEKDADSIAGTVGKNAISLAIALKRPYVGYLKGVRARCERILKTKLSCKQI